MDHRDVGGIEPARDDDTADARHVVACVERVPAPVEKNFRPGVEVHQRGIERYADISEIAVAIARGNVHGPAERDGEMREVAADTEPLFQTLHSGARRARMRVAEFEMIVDEIENRLHARPARFHVAELRPGETAELVDLAIPATPEIAQRLIRQFLHRHFAGLDIDFVHIAAVAYDRLGFEARYAGGRNQSRAAIAERICEFAQRDIRLGEDRVAMSKPTRISIDPSQAVSVGASRL